jgi:hypothetical protein
MSEDAMVRLLLEVSGGCVLDDRDTALAQAAARWAHGFGRWRPYDGNGFIYERDGMTYRIMAGAAQMLEIRVCIGGRHWVTHLQARIEHLGHGLDLLATEGLLPARFSTLGRRALEDYAQACDRSSKIIAEMSEELQQGGLRGELQVKAETLALAAEQARSFAGAELAVMS